MIQMQEGTTMTSSIEGIPNRNQRSSSDETVIRRRGYSVKEIIGIGSYAVVYKLMRREATESKDSLACKVIDTSQAPKEYVTKFLPRELDILSKINHPHLIYTLCVIQRKSKFFIFMRYAEKGDLLDYILKNGELTDKQARIWFRQVVLGLEYLHEMDIAHRDIKCENVLVTSNYNLKLADFGFAKFTVDINGKFKYSQTFCGSLGYAPPEILKGKAYDPKAADVWSAGVVLFVMVNRSMPFNGNSVRVLYDQQKEQKWKINPKIEHQIAPEVKSLFAKMFQPNPKTRIKINAIMKEDWFTGDEKLMKMTSEEYGALRSAIDTKVQMRPMKKKNIVKLKDGQELVIMANPDEATKSKEMVEHETTEQKKGSPRGSADVTSQRKQRYG